MRGFTVQLIADKLLKEFCDQVPITIREGARRSESFPQFSCSPLWDRQIRTELDTTISFPERNPRRLSVLEIVRARFRSPGIRSKSIAPNFDIPASDHSPAQSLECLRLHTPREAVAPNIPIMKSMV